MPTLLSRLPFDTLITIAYDNVNLINRLETWTNIEDRMLQVL